MGEIEGNMGIFGRFHRVPPFFVGSLCGGALYVYYYQTLQTKYHTMPRAIWDIMYKGDSNRQQSVENESLNDLRGPTTASELYEVALNKRKNREYYRDAFIIGWNDSVRSVHRFLIRHIFGEELQ